MKPEELLAAMQPLAEAVAKATAEYTKEVASYREELAQTKEELQRVRTQLEELAGSTPKPTPTPEPTPEPEQPDPAPTPEPEVPKTGAIKINDFDGGDWLNGVWIKDETRRVSIPQTDLFTVGDEVTLADGEPRRVKVVEDVGNNISLELTGGKIDPNVAGAPNNVTKVADGEPDDLPEPGPEQPAPIPEVPKPEPKPDVEGFTSSINDFTDDKYWDRGVWRGDKAGISIANSDENRKRFVEGVPVKLATGEIRLVTWAQEVGQNISLFLEGTTLDASKVGAPNKITVATDEEPQPAPKPTEPAPTPTPTPGPTPIPPVSGVDAQLPAFGLNFGGVGNNPWLAAINGPDGVRGDTHYSITKEAHIACYAKNLNGKPWIARLPIAGEYLISKDGDKLNQRYVNDILMVMDRIHKYGGKVLLDMHNYYRWWKKVPSSVAGRDMKVHNDHLAKGSAVWTVINEPDCPVTNKGFAQLWVDILTGPIGKHPAMFMAGLVNEPHNRGSDKVDINSKWPVCAQLCVNEIRKVNKTIWITVAGNFYSSAKLWTSVSKDLHKITDPQDKLIFEAHQYMDKQGNGGGTWASHSDPVAADQGTKDWAGFINWCIEKNVRGMCGEVGGPATAGQYLTAVRRLCDLMASHRMPVVFWMGGTGQNDSYANGMNTSAGVLKPNAAPLMERIGRTFPSYGPKK